jgi:hypothetical protein
MMGGLMAIIVLTICNATLGLGCAAWSVSKRRWSPVLGMLAAVLPGAITYFVTVLAFSMRLPN